MSSRFTAVKISLTNAAGHQPFIVTFSDVDASGMSKLQEGIDKLVADYLSWDGERRTNSPCAAVETGNVADPSWSVDAELAKASMSEAVHQAIGEASMCWSEPPAGVFHDARAVEIGRRLLDAIEKTQEYPLGGRTVR